MKRVTKSTGKSGTDRPKCPTSSPGDIHTDPNMIELKRLVATLSSERRQALDAYLTDQESEPANDFMTDLLDMVTWWRSRKDSSTVHEAPRYRPLFPGRRDNRGIRINRRLIDDTLKKARELFPGPSSGGKLSPTIEFLCWQFLEFDEKYLREDDCE